MKKYLLILLLAFSFATQAQPKQPVTEADYNNMHIEMADNMRAEGKIYVVVAILVTILAGFVVYTIRIDSKVTKVEKALDQKNEGS